MEAVSAVASGERFLDPSIAAARDRDTRRTPAALSALSEREFEIFRQLAEGHPVEAIASSLCLSAKTVANYGTAIRAKLRAENRAELARIALAAGIVAPP